MAVVLAAGFLLETYLAEAPVGEPFIEDLRPDEAVAVAAGVAFLLSLAVRVRMPAVPLALAFVALALLGRGQLGASASLLLGLMLMAYSVGAWSGGRAALIGALGLGALAGLVVLRGAVQTIEAQLIAGPVVKLFGPWLVGVLVRGIRARRGDPRVARERRFSFGRGWPAPDSAGRDETVRELREVVERAMSTVIMGARDARDAMRGDPGRTERALAAIESAGTEALEETQRLTGLLLSPDGTPAPGPQPGLADLAFLAEEMTRAGLPVDTHVTGRVVPLTPDLDGVAYRVVQEALVSALEGTRNGTAHVFVRYEPEALAVEIADNGEAAGRDGKQETEGLLAVRKEVAALGGRLDAGPDGDGQYWVIAQFPYEPDWR
jgi:hypothetical protein